MAVQLGMYYFDPTTSFPAVVVKTVDIERVLLRVWTDGGDRTIVAVVSDSAGTGVFVSDG